MPDYTINATISFSAWVLVEANDPEEAVAIAAGLDAEDYDYDASTGEVSFNVTPEVEPA